MNIRVDGEIIKCEVCGLEIFKTIHQIKTTYNTCSRSCSLKLASKEKRIECSCFSCGKLIYLKPSKFKITKNPTCSIICCNKMKKSFKNGLPNKNLMGLNVLERYFLKKMYSIKSRATKYKRNVDIDYKFLVDLYNKQEGKCYYSGMEMSINHCKQFNSCSVERLDSKKGYTKENTVLCLLCLNVMKNNYKLNDFYKVITNVYNKGILNECEDFII